MKKKRMFFLRGVAVVTAALVVLLCAAFVLTRQRSFSPTENRNLQTRPALTLSDALSGRYEDRFDDYVADQFPFRDAWVALKTAIDRLGGRTESNGVYLGGDGYLIQDFTMPSEADYRALIEARELGGTCLNRGCIPTKALLHGAEIYAEARDGGDFGLIMDENVIHGSDSPESAEREIAIFFS